MPDHAHDQRKADKPKDEHQRKEDKKQEAEKAKPHHDELDEALADTFPASDPPSPASKGTTKNPKAHEKNGKDAASHSSSNLPPFGLCLEG